MTSPSGFPAADVEKELINPGADKDFQVDPVSENVATSKEIKEQDEEAERKEQEKKDSMQNLKTAFIVSGIVVAIAGAVFAITKKLREK